MKNIIAFAGKAGSGKDTAARLLVAKYKYKRVAFADSLKNFCKSIWQVTDDELNDRFLKDHKLQRYPFKSPRSLMKETADSLKKIMPDLFLQHWMKAAVPYEKIVVPDLRFIDELDLLAGFDAQFLRVIRPNMPSYDSHSSETELDNIDLPSIDNNGSIDDFEKAIQSLIDKDILKV